MGTGAAVRVDICAVDGGGWDCVFGAEGSVLDLSTYITYLTVFTTMYYLMLYFCIYVLCTYKTINPLFFLSELG